MESTMPYIWLAIIIIMSIAEACTAQLVSIWFVCGAIVALVVSLFVPSVIIQTAVFVAITALALFATRPFLRKIMNFKKEDTNLGRYLGKTGLVITEINNEIGKGQVNVMGSIWTARSVDNKIIKEGDNVIIESIEGVKLIVKSL